MKRRVLKGGCFILLVMYIFITLCGCVNGASYDPTKACMQTVVYENDAKIATWGEDVKISSRIYELIFGNEKQNKLPHTDELMLIPCGDVFGIKIREEHPTVKDVDVGSPLRRGDKIIKISDIEISDAVDVKTALDGCTGAPVTVEIIRDGVPMCVSVLPKKENGKHMLGVTLKKTSAGIGTITFIHPASGVYGGLGHPVCEQDSTTPVKIKEGDATRVILGSLKKGVRGAPGELSGIIDNTRIGSIDENTECGVFGVLTAPEAFSGTPIPVSRKGDIKLGDAEMISTIKNGKKASYKITITEIDESSEGSKSFKIRVTDPALISMTGGILRGMSGSPIVQNGKLIGAVTHVMVNDPTEGYGIFIENMLAAIPQALN